ncbi:MAG: thioredoxin family protein [Campylobacterales bacterium]|nr:thioredoxin family protein [Campylobacterales bacterium]
MILSKFIFNIVFCITIIMSHLGANSLNFNPADDYDKIIQIAQESKKNILLYVYRDGCPWCKKLKENTLQDQRVIKYINEKFIFVTMAKDNWTLPSIYAPNVVPSVFLIDQQNENMIYWHKGYIEADDMLDLLQRIDKVLSSN